MPVPFFEMISHRCAKRAVHKESIMSAFWLLLVPVAGFGWSVVRGVMAALPKSNEDFVFC
ncbi:hypothetical protein MASSI9I_90313 [Massilia sp. 9I]|nr:hypothetical protein MASSI9I_90313 [Massilia sp. 9I]